MLKIRLKRMGRKGSPCYRFVVIESTKKRDGRSVDEIGFYNSKTKKGYFDIKKLYEWYDKGARPTDSVIGIGHKILIAKLQAEVKAELEALQNPQVGSQLQALIAAELQAELEALQTQNPQVVDLYARLNDMLADAIRTNGGSIRDLIEERDPELYEKLHGDKDEDEDES